MAHSILTGAIILFASFTFSFAGFGFSLIAVPLLMLYLDTQQAVIFQYPYALVMVIYLAYKSRKDLIWRQIWPLLLGATLGLPIGLYFFHVLPEPILKKLLGGFVILFVVTSLLPVQGLSQYVQRKNRFWGAVFGLFSGAFQGAYNTGGPPVVIYSISVQTDKSRAKGIMLSIFVYLYIFLLIPYGFGKLLTLSGLMNNLYYVPAMLVGTWMGSQLFERVDNTTYKKVIIILLFIAALFLCIRS